MIVEFVGPGGVGKTTVEPLVADLLGISYYAGKKRHDIDGSPLPAWRVWAERITSTMTSPRLTIAGMSAHRGTLSARARFAADLTRREQRARQASRLGSGILASGSIHAVVMAAAGRDIDVEPLIDLVHLADVYVELHADPDTVLSRLAGRWEQAGIPLETTIAEAAGRYETAARAVLQAVPRPVVSANADADPETVAGEVADLIRPYLADARHAG